MQTDGHFHSATGHQQERIEVYAGNCSRIGMPADPTDAGRVPGYKAIRYGLAAIKHVGETAMEAVIREREAARRFHFTGGFLQRVWTPRIANRKMLESLIKAGRV